MNVYNNNAGKLKNYKAKCKSFKFSSFIAVLLTYDYSFFKNIMFHENVF